MPRRPVKSSKKRAREQQLPALQSKKGEVRAMEARIAAAEEDLRAKKARLEEIQGELSLLNTEINNAEHKVAYRTSRLKDLSNAANALPLPSRPSSTFEETDDGFSVKITQEMNESRKRNATDARLGKTQVSERRRQMWRCARVLHGATGRNHEPALRGIFSMLCAKDKMFRLRQRILHRDRLSGPLKKMICKTWSKSYTSSKENIIRSLNVYYAYSPSGKRKYIMIRRAAKANFETVELPNLVSYAVLASFINSIDIGKVEDINPRFTTDVGCPEMPGRYRNARDYIPHLAQFYLKVDSWRKDKLKSFPFYDDMRIDKESLMFIILLGGDGAPICGSSVLVSFMNVGERLPCSKEAHLLMGTDAEEDSPVFRHYFKMLVSDLKFLESQVFNLDVFGVNRKVEFRLGELPNDMKYLHFLAGELTNAAKYFTTFADVSSDNCLDINGTFGDKSSDTWHPWSYQKRLEDVKLVEAFKKVEAAKDILEATKRSNVTTFIGNQKSRQEFVPLLEQYIIHAKFEPLHGKNNSVKELFIKLMRVSTSNSHFNGVTEFKKLPLTLLFVRLVKFVRTVMSCNMLGKRMKSWFNENGGKCESSTSFSYRFRGQESRAFMTHFPEICRFLIKSLPNDEEKTLVLRTHYQSVLLRRLVSASVRISDIDQDVILQAKKDGAALYRSCIAWDGSISPTTWCFTQVMPYHSYVTYRKYGFGLGCNTMEGREQKHQQIAKYMKQSTWHDRWQTTFKHEYVSLIYLRLSGFDQKRYCKRSISYVPKMKANSCPTCCSLTVASSCDLCDHILMETIRRSLTDEFIHKSREVTQKKAQQVKDAEELRKKRKKEAAKAKNKRK